ncbi:MAG: metal-dependent hydrolase [Ruminococcus flavefaciens]|nr:metal-dependent hydrolase [Ruminococcus flavefaciens]MCM1228714.1 metal-dependent hydrolase [Ruminococcus flavefaciens]
MMGKTHIFMGTATALALTFADTPIEILSALAGGAVGGMMPDTDLDSLKNIKDLNTKAIAGTIAGLCFAVDFIFKCGMIESIKASNHILALIGLVAFIVLYFVGAFADHRSFTHSLLATVLYSTAVGLMCRPLAIPFAIGFLAHIILDCTNKKGVRMFYPSKKKFKLNWFYASKKANIVFYYIGIALTVVFGVLALIKWIFM